MEYNIFHKNPRLQSRVIDKKSFTYRIIIEVLERYLKKQKKILDIGCGVGTISLFLANRGKIVTGIDISSNAIRAAKKSAIFLNLDSRTSFKKINFPFQDIAGKFDAILILEVIEHLEDDELALEKIYKSLNKKGILILSTPSSNAPLYKLGLLKDFDKRVGHLRRYNKEELVNLCKMKGFSIVTTKETEGILRNFLFTNRLAGKFVRFIRYYISDLVTYLDNILTMIFGGSDIFIIAQKP